MSNKITIIAIIAFLVGAGITYFVISPSDTGMPTETQSLQSLTDNPQLPLPVIDAYYNAAGAMAFSSVSVVGNSLRIKRM